MKNIIKKYKIMWKQNLLRKIREQKKINKYYKEQLDRYILTERKWNDELNQKQVEIRRLSLENRKLKGDL